MLAMVTSVSLLVAVFAAGYMHGDPGYPRFFAAVSLFVFSMCMLVLAGNFLLLFVFWEGVGLCSYLLIGFWYQQAERGRGGQEGVRRQPHRRLRLSARHLSDLDDVRLARLCRRARQSGSDWPRSRRRSPGVITLICLLLFLGAMGKSAQFPLHVWLPDAMEGPTPVSALIHAATMVTAGVYMVARCTPLFVHRADGAAGRQRHRRSDGAARRADRADAERPEARAGLLHGQPAGLHVHGAGRRRGRAGSGHRRPRRPACSTCSRTRSSRRCCSSRPAA